MMWNVKYRRLQSWGESLLEDGRSLFKTVCNKEISQLVSAFGVAWEFPQGGNYWTVGKMLLEGSSEDVVVESSAGHKEELLGGFLSFTEVKL